VNRRPGSGPAIEAKGMAKRHGDEVLALDGVNLSIPSDRI
jgi:hypothetical protein